MQLKLKLQIDRKLAQKKIDTGEERTMKLTPGKLAGLNAVSNERGVIAAAAMDQRGSLQKSLAKSAARPPQARTWKTSRRW